MTKFKLEYAAEYIFELWVKRGKPEMAQIKCPNGCLTDKTIEELVNWGLEVSEYQVLDNGIIYNVKWISPDAN